MLTKCGQKVGLSMVNDRLQNNGLLVQAARRQQLPTTKSKLKARYELTCNRCEYDRSRLKEGEEPVVDNEDSEEAILDEVACEEVSAAAAAENQTVV
jgi:hypothetical protein